MSLYTDIKYALAEQIDAHLKSLDETIEVHKVPYQNLIVFPAVAIELERRRKPKRGVGVRQLEFELVVWVYTNILDENDAEDECLRIMELVEEGIESDKSLGGLVGYLSIDTDAQFGTVQQDESFLQGARISVTITKLIR